MVLNIVQCDELVDGSLSTHGLVWLLGLLAIADLVRVDLA